MSWEQFWFVLIGCVLAMWACRVIPLFLLKGRELPPRLAQALGFIPPAAFAALVATF
ncbi:MAG: AzlD domain-containing protein [Adlercreutzia sp.]